MVHLAMPQNDESGSPVTSGEHITDEQYNATPCPEGPSDGSRPHHRLRRRPRTGCCADAARRRTRCVVHARNSERLAVVQDLVDRSAAGVVGNLADPEETRGVAGQVTTSDG
jgi:hypothetical protein